MHNYRAVDCAAGSVRFEAGVRPALEHIGAHVAEICSAGRVNDDLTPSVAVYSPTGGT
jgi:hypothetical protein